MLLPPGPLRKEHLHQNGRAVLQALVWACILLPTQTTHIWQHCSGPCIVAPRLGIALTAMSCRLQALGWMCMFLPTQAIHKGDSMDWNSLVSDALLLLEADEQNQFWKSMWISILARLAKHDHQGVLQVLPS